MSEVPDWTPQPLHYGPPLDRPQPPPPGACRRCGGKRKIRRLHYRTDCKGERVFRKWESCPDCVRPREAP